MVLVKMTIASSIKRPVATYWLSAGSRLSKALWALLPAYHISVWVGGWFRDLWAMHLAGLMAFWTWSLSLTAIEERVGFSSPLRISKTAVNSHLPQFRRLLSGHRDLMCINTWSLLMVKTARDFIGNVFCGLKVDSNSFP